MRKTAGAGCRVPGAACATIAALLSVLALGQSRAQDLGISVGAKAPAAIVETLEGKSVDLATVMGKTPVMIEFWATWCPNCKELEPTVKTVYTKYAGQVKILGGAVSVNQSPELVRRYVKKHKLPGVILFDRKGNASGAYDVPATSYIVVIDKAGTVVYTGLGGDQNLEAAVKKALPKGT
jgi:thiol-disulfide isomerase/thioredoxin